MVKILFCGVLRQIYSRRQRMGGGGKRHGDLIDSTKHPRYFLHYIKIYRVELDLINQLNYGYFVNEFRPSLRQDHFVRGG